MNECKYRDCNKPATTGQFCSASHKSGYYRDQRGSAEVAGIAELVAHATGSATGSADIPVPDTNPGHILTQSDLSDFGWRGAQPTYLDKPTGYEHSTDSQLESAIQSVRVGWQATAQYAERCYRVVHELTAYYLPNYVISGC